MVIKIMDNEAIKSKQIVLEPQDEKAHPDVMVIMIIINNAHGLT